VYSFQVKKECLVDNLSSQCDAVKVEAAFSKLRLNPQWLEGVKSAHADLLAKLNMGLNEEEELALARRIFAGSPGEQVMRDTDPVPIHYAGCLNPPQLRSVALLSVDCGESTCPKPQLHTSIRCLPCPPPLPDTSVSCTSCPPVPPFDVSISGSCPTGTC
jgi:hypothetical protein